MTELLHIGNKINAQLQSFFPGGNAETAAIVVIYISQRVGSKEELSEAGVAELSAGGEGGAFHIHGIASFLTAQADDIGCFAEEAVRRPGGTAHIGDIPHIESITQS